MKFSILASALMFVSIFSSVGFSDETTPPPANEQPLRYANAHLVITKSTMTLDPATGKSSVTSEIVCDKMEQVPVFDFRKKNTQSINIPDHSCEATLNGETVYVNSSIYVGYGRHSLYPNAPVEEFKNASAWSYIYEKGSTRPADLAIPAQTFTTRDLSTKNLILNAVSPQYSFCQKQTGDCKIVNPVVFNVLWDIQDSE